MNFYGYKDLCELRHPDLDSILCASEYSFARKWVSYDEYGLNPIFNEFNDVKEQSHYYFKWLHWGN